VDPKLKLKLKSRLAHLEKLIDEPVMEDFDSGLRAGYREELEFLKELLREYGEPKKG
jgi:hypothetical protein